MVLNAGMLSTDLLLNPAEPEHFTRCVCVCVREQQYFVT